MRYLTCKITRAYKQMYSLSVSQVLCIPCSLAAHVAGEVGSSLRAALLYKLSRPIVREGISDPHDLDWHLGHHRPVSPVGSGNTFADCA